MRPRLAAAAFLAAALVVASACGGSADAPRTPREDLLLGEFLDASPEACGLAERPPSVAAVDRAETLPAQVEAVEHVVERIRGLQAPSLRPAFVSRKELAVRLEQLVRKELSERDLADSQRALAALGAVPPGFDLQTVIDALGRATAGLYDKETRQILVASKGGRTLTPDELEALAHELEHALSDRRLGLPEGDRADRWGDTHLAGAALGEGSALLTEFRYVAAQTGVEFVRLLLRAPANDLFALPQLPYAIEQSLVFPYLEGIGFVCNLYRRGGWAAVNRAFDRPPRSSAEILFPERYLRGERPARPRPPDELPEPWTRSRAGGVFGAADLLWLFRAPGGDQRRALPDALPRAGAWAGGRIDVWQDGGHSAVGVALRQRRGAPDLCASLALWYERAFPAARKRESGGATTFSDARQTAVIRCAQGEARLGIAPNASLAGRLAAG
jgi:hypothetical protein